MISVLVSIGAWFAHAVQAPLAYGVLADSNATASTVIYRDANSQSTMIPTNQTIAQLRVLVPPAVGTEYFCSNCTGSVGATGKIVVATGTAAGNFADAAGGAFQ